MMETIDLLRAALAALKDAGVARGQVKLPDGLELSIEFAPELPPLEPQGEMPTPGGWKTPLTLDEPFRIVGDDK